jgi:hypothetical protein
VDGVEIERTFETTAEILKNWWDEEQGTDLPDGDDEVLELVIDGESYHTPGNFVGVISRLEAMFWQNFK